MQDEFENASDSRDKLWSLIKDMRFAMFTTSHGGGHMHGRPMTTQNTGLGAENCLWFFVARSGEPYADISADSNVCLSYAHPGDDTYVSVSGIAHVNNDIERIKALWTKFAEAWFPAGPTDPNLALVEVQITHAHYWNVKESKIHQLFSMSKASVSGSQPTQLGESVEVSMS